MALDTTLSRSAPLRGPSEPVGHPSLTLLPPPARDIWQSEEADIEAIAFMDDAARSMDELIAAELLLDIPSAQVLHLASRVAFRAGLARAEVLRLRGGDDVA